MAGVDALLPETVDDEDIENAIQEFENDAMDAARIDEMNETFELEIELVKVFPMAKKKIKRTVSQPPTRVHSSNSATDEWNTTTVTYLFLLIL